MKTHNEEFMEFVEKSIGIKLEPWQRRMVNMIFAARKRGERIYIEDGGRHQAKIIRRLAQYDTLNRLPLGETVHLICATESHKREAQKYITNPNVKVILASDLDDCKGRNFDAQLIGKWGER